MSYAIAWIVKKSSEARVAVESAYAFFLLVMMASMLGGAIIYLLNPSTLGIVEAVALNMGVMTIGILAVLKYWISGQQFENEGRETTEEISLEQSVTISNAYVIYFLVFFASMVATGLIYIVDPSSYGLELALGAGTAIMTAGVLAILRYSSRHKVHNELSANAARITRSGIERSATVVLVLVNEFLMGWAFLLAAEPSAINTSVTLSGLLEGFGNVVSSYWFIFIMVAEMAFTIFMFRRGTSRSLTTILSLQAAIMFFSPPAINSEFWTTSSVYIGSALMTVLFVYFYEYLYRNKLLEKAISRYIISLISIYALMMAGLFTWIIYGSTVVFAFSIVLEMSIYFNVIITRRGFSESEMRSWSSTPLWVFGILVATFVAEFFMGGLIDIVYYGSSFISGIHLVALSGSILSMLAALLFDFLSVFATITGSAWYLVMMGAEMGALVLFKVKQTRELETKIRLGLVVVAYAVYTVFMPYFLFSESALPRIPFVGWNMGIGTSGAIAPAFIIAIAGTYTLSGVLALLFGGRQVCSLFCSASLMYQGTFPDSLKIFNRSSTIGRKLLTSRMNSIYKVVSTAVIASLVIASVASYMNSIHLVNITIYGVDVASFLYIFYFDFLWYIIFLAMPFIGVYGCATTGMCHWGLFNRFVGRLGFFKLKVRDPNLCASCETKDCAKACPVGLTDLPGHFISKGEFKSHKCIGVGDCVSSCPYENEYFYDVRNWLGKISPTSRSRHSTSLPLLREQVNSQDVSENR